MIRRNRLGSPTSPSGTLGRIWQANSRPFCSARTASDFSVSSSVVRSSNSDMIQFELPRLNLGKVQDVSISGRIESTSSHVETPIHRQLWLRK